MTAHTLRDYQVRGIELAREAMREHARVVLQMPTGAGKTVVGVEIVRRAVGRSRRALWLAHRRELIAQAVAALDRAGVPCGTIAASSDRSAPDAPVQVATIQTLLARDVELPPVDLIVADECHHLGEGAETWAALLDRYPGTRVVGLTATPERGDGTGLAPLFSHLVQVITVRELTERGMLVPCLVWRPSSYLKGRGQTGNVIAKDPDVAWAEQAGDRSGFVFAATIEEAEGYAQRLSARGIVARAVHAKTPKDERAAILGGFRDGTVRALCNVYVFTEGTDLPSASCCVLARGCSSAGMFLQIVGRVLRPAPGKRDALLIDLPGVTHLHGMPEDERLWRLDGRACVVAGRTCQVCRKPVDEYPCSFCGYAPDPETDGASAQTEVVDAPLVKFERMIAQSPVQRLETLERWVRQAVLKGYKPGYVRHKWRAVYGEEPDPAAWDTAWRRASSAGRP